MPTLEIDVGGYRLSFDTDWDTIMGVKDELKRIGYRFDSYGKVWRYRLPTPSVVDETLKTLVEHGLLRKDMVDRLREEIMERIRRRYIEFARAHELRSGISELKNLVYLRIDYIPDYNLYKLFRDYRGTTVLPLNSIARKLQEAGYSGEEAYEKLVENMKILAYMDSQGRLLFGDKALDALKKDLLQLVRPRAVVVKTEKDYVVIKVNKEVPELQELTEMKYNVMGYDVETGRVEWSERRAGLVRRVGPRTYAVSPALIPYIISILEKKGIDTSELRKWLQLNTRLLEPPDLSKAKENRLRPYQEEALRKWMEHGCRGFIVIPTGGGKTIVALEAIRRLKAPTLIVVPTLDLVEQWRNRIRELLGYEPGVVAGGEHSVKPITITTYDSLVKYADEFAGRFKLVICDEAHHVSAETFMEALRRLYPEYTMGLSATPERVDRNEAIAYTILGPKVYEISYLELARQGYIAPFTVEAVPVSPSKETLRKLEELRERLEKREIKRGVYTTYVRRLMQRDPAKIAKLLDIVRGVLSEKPSSRILVFTIYRDQAHEAAEALRKAGYRVAELHGGLPRHDRTRILRDFREGKLNILVVTQVGDEGIDIPDADVGIILSGYAGRSYANRQLIQRIGRIVRPRPGKVARLYIIYTDHPESPEPRYVGQWLEVIDRVAPQKEMKKIAREQEAKTAKTMEKPSHTQKVPDWLQREIDRIRRKTPRSLTLRDKALLLLYMLYTRPSIVRDIGREAKTRGRLVSAWLRDPSRRDIPGLDTPEAKKLLRKLRRLLKRKTVVTEKDIEKILLRLRTV